MRPHSTILVLHMQTASKLGNYVLSLVTVLQRSNLPSLLMIICVHFLCFNRRAGDIITANQRKAADPRVVSLSNQSPAGSR